MDQGPTAHRKTFSKSYGLSSAGLATMDQALIRLNRSMRSNDPIDRKWNFFTWLGAKVAQHPGGVVCLWIAAAVALALIAPGWEQLAQDDDIRFMPSYCSSVRGYDLLSRAFASELYGSRLVLVIEGEDRPLTASDHVLMGKMVQRIQDLARAEPELGIRKIRSAADPLLGDRLCSRDGCCSLIVVSLETPFLAQRTEQAVMKLEANLRPWLKEQSEAKSLQVRVSGPAGVGRDLNHAVLASFHHTTIATVALVIAILLVIYRSPVLALIPLAAISVSLWIAFSLLALAAMWFGLNLVNITHVFVVVILFGVGTDYCLFLVSRFREEAAKCDGDSRKAAGQALTRVGWALTASAGTVICGLGMMAFADFAKLRSTGPALAISLLVALGASLTLAPALLALLGPWAHWPLGQVSVAHARQRPVLADRWLVRLITGRPGMVWLGMMLLLTPFALSGGQISYEYAVLSDLPANAESRAGLETIQQRYTKGEAGPLSLFLYSEKPWTQPESWLRLNQVTARLASLENIAEVRSPDMPFGKEVWQHCSMWQRAERLIALMFVRPYYLGLATEGHIARVDIILKSDPYTAPSVATLDEIRQALASELNITDEEHSFFGVTAIMDDVATVQQRDSLRIYILVVVCVQLIMLVIVRRPIIAVYLMISVLFSYFVTLGLTSIVGELLWGSQGAALDWKVPFFLFTILVAVGEDYNIFLVSRILEEEQHSGFRTAVGSALVHTGTTITSCGLIMAGTFATLLLGELATLRQLGLALAIGVLLDTFAVRLFLVPSFLLLFDRLRERRKAGGNAPRIWIRLPSAWQRQADAGPRIQPSR